MEPDGTGRCAEDVHRGLPDQSGFQFWFAGMLGVTDSLGCPDGQEPPGQVVVLSHKFWKRHFNGDPSW